MTPTQQKVFDYLTGDFRALWKALERDHDATNRGNLVFAMICRELIEVGIEIYDEKFFEALKKRGYVDSALNELLGASYYFLVNQGPSFTGALPGRPFDPEGPAPPKHDGETYIRTEYLFRDILATFDELKSIGA